MVRPAGPPIGPDPDIALGEGVYATIVNNVRVMELRKTQRAKMLLQCRAFFEGSHFDHLARSWDGTARDPGVGYLRARLKPQGFVPVQAIPYGQRKPDTGMPLVRQIVNRFSEMLLGHSRQPSLHVPADLDTERYLEAIFDEAQCWDVLMEARDVAGSCGAAAIVPSVVDGVPTSEVLMPYDVHVYKWAPGANWQPMEVVEQRLVERLVPDAQSGRLQVKKFWRTRLWTQKYVVYYDDVPEDEWDATVPLKHKPENKVEHKAGRCPVIWYQNTRNTKSPDGQPDCAGVWHLIDQVDRIMSQVYKAARANVDPTLLVKEEERLRKKIGTITKGGLMTVSANGDASYLEMDGSSVKVGIEVVDLIRQEVLQTAECVIVDPNNAGAYKSGEAIQLLWRAMESKTNRLRVTMTQTIRELTRIWLTLGKNLGIANLEDPEPGAGILLPPVVTYPKQDDEAIIEGKTPEPEIRAQSVGTGSHVDVQWPPYFDPTPKQLAETSKAMAVAKAANLLSEETRVGEMAKTLGLDAGEEYLRVVRDQLQQKQEAELDFDKEMEKMESQVSQGGEEPKEKVKITQRTGSPRIDGRTLGGVTDQGGPGIEETVEFAGDS